MGSYLLLELFVVVVLFSCQIVSVTTIQLLTAHETHCQNILQETPAHNKQLLKNCSLFKLCRNFRI